MSCVELAVASIGYRIPRSDFACKVHSVFARACNFEYDDALLSLVAPSAGAGPTTTAVNQLVKQFQEAQKMFRAAGIGPRLAKSRAKKRKKGRR